MDLFWTAVLFVVVYALSYAFCHKDTPGVAMLILFVVWLVVSYIYLNSFVLSIVPLFKFLGLVGQVFFIVVPTVLGNKHAPGNETGSDEGDEAAKG